MRALRTGAMAGRLSRAHTAKQTAAALFRGFQMLKSYLLMRLRDRLLEDRADQYRRFNLRLRALRVFQASIGLGPSDEGFQFYSSPSLCLSDSNLKEHESTFATQQAYSLARRKRLGFMFRYL